MRGRLRLPERTVRQESLLSGQLVGKDPGESINSRLSPGGRL